MTTEEKKVYFLENREYHEHHHLSGNPALYVGTYAKYNDGNLGGMWVDLSTFNDVDDLLEFCESVHWEEANPEIMFQDCEEVPYKVYRESVDRERLDFMLEYAELEEKHRCIVDAYIDYQGWYNGLSVRDIMDKYIDYYESERDFAEELVNDCYSFDMSDFALRYFDYDAFARDLFLDGYHYENGYVFRTY